MPAFSNGNFDNPENYDSYESSGDASMGGNGNVLSSIIDATSKLGTTALLAFGPQNSGLATNPYGQAVRYGAGPVQSTSNLTTFILIAVLAVVGIFAYKKL
jgi:hypothetical protein